MSRKSKAPSAEWLFLAVQAALEAGEIIMSIYNREDSIDELDIVEKADGSPVTKVDKAADKAISSILEPCGIPILSEEGEEVPYKERSKWPQYWLTDPLDGTKDFIKRNGEFTVNIALLIENEPVIGVVYSPFKKILYFADTYKGAFKIDGIDLGDLTTYDNLMEQSTKLPLAFSRQGLVIVTSRSRQNDAMFEYLNSIKKKGMPVTLIRSGSSEKICMVAEGVADVYPRFSPCMEWDTAAAHAIAKAAGCEIYQMSNRLPLEYNKEDLMNPWFIVEPIAAKKEE